MMGGLKCSSIKMCAGLMWLGRMGAFMTGGVGMMNKV